MQFITTSIPFICCLAALTSTTFADSGLAHEVLQRGFQDRVHETLEWRSDRVDPEVNPEAGGLYEIAAKLALEVDLDWASQRLVEVLESPRGDMFWMFPVTAVAYLGQGKLSDEADEALRRAWRTYMPQRGDTENHWIMYYVSIYLMAQLWPEHGPEDWFNGKSSAENRTEAREYISWWVNVTTSIGQGEYDSPHYLPEFLIVMAYLAAWAEEPDMRQRGRMMVDYLAVDYANSSLNGIHVGAHSRIVDRQIMEPWQGLSSYFGWLFFDNTPVLTNYGGLATAFAFAARHYEVPEVIHRIGTDRDSPFQHRELKRTRQRWRNADEKVGAVYKTTYLTRDYALGSDQGGLFSPIQQHSWSLVWDEADPRERHNRIFSIHPHWSAFELQMFFTEYPDSMPEGVTQQGKPTYMAADTFLGGSPYEQIHQEKDAVVVLYQISEEAPHQHINGLFSKDLDAIEEDDSGWIFARAANTFIAYYPLAEYSWKPIEGGGQRLYSPSANNGTILQAASADEFDSWGAFKQAIRELPLETQIYPVPRVEFTSLRGDAFICEFGQTPIVNGSPVNYEDWALFDGPFLQAQPHSRQLRMQHGNLVRDLDFRTLEIRDRVIEAEPAPFDLDSVRRR
ncbi:MAG: hypothetical protein JJU20_11445 [Opitutales bacterium]|nr:hypothetical protein [Opitutales bacterium]